MPPKSKASTTNGRPAKATPPPSTNGTATPVTTISDDKKDTLDATTAVTSGRPDKKLYDSEQETIKKEIEGIQVKLNAVKEKIGLVTKSNGGNDKRAALKAELDGLRDRQSGNKMSRGKILDQLKTLQDNYNKKNKELQAAKAKIPYKSVAEVDAHIKQLEKQVESGNMKLADEKRALHEISLCKRSRRTVESFRGDEEALAADSRAIAEIKEQLDNPEVKALSEQYDSIKLQLDQLKLENDEAYAGRSKLFEERDGLQAKINVLWNSKRESAQRYKDANDRYWNKVNEERTRRNERMRAQRDAEEAEKKKEVAERLLEEAQIPAYQAQIEDCQTLIDYFDGKSSGTVTFKSNPVPPKTDLAGVPKLELRQVDSPTEGLVIRKKKGEDEESYFVGTKGKGKGKKSAAPKTNGTTEASSNNTQLNIPLPTLSALMTLSIPPPASTTDVPRLIQDLRTKKAWFEANQDRVTSENVSKAKGAIEKLNSVAATEDSPQEPPVEVEKVEVLATES